MKTLKLKLDSIFYHIISASWFFELPNKKVIKIELFYAWMSLAGFFGAYGLARDGINKVEYSTQYYVFISIFLIGTALKLGTVFGYKASKAVRDKFWETQLMRFLDPSYWRQFEAYPDSSIRLKILKEMRKAKYGVSVEYTRENAPTWQKIQIVLLLGLTGLGLFLGLNL